MQRPPAAFTRWLKKTLKHVSMSECLFCNGRIGGVLYQITKQDGGACSPNGVFVMAKPLAKRTVTGGFTRDISVFRWMSRLRVSGCYRDKKERSRETAGAQDCR